MITFGTNGKHNGKTSYLAFKSGGYLQAPFASITFEDVEWIYRRLPNGRVERFDRLAQAKNEALRG